jgi:HSP20 family protein
MLPVLWNDPVLAPMTGGPINRLASLFDRGLGAGIPFSEAGIGVPMAMWEDDDHIYVEAELPGLIDQDMDITVHDGKLFIRGERKPEEGRTYLYNGRIFGWFERVITLPGCVATDDVRADLKDGLLSLALPKSPEAKPKKITLKTS